MSKTTTVYSQVADSLRRRILSGNLQPGEMLPPERELCEQFASSRITIRRALQILAEDMLVVRRQGIGTFVSATPTRKIPLLNADFNGSLSLHAPDVTRRLDCWEWRSADEQIASLLQVRPGARVLFARRFDLLDGRPVAYDEIYLLEEAADLLTANELADLSFLQRWQEVQQIRIGHLHQSVEAIAADRTIAGLLKEKAGKPVLKGLDVMHLATGAPCGVFWSYYRHDLFRLTSTVTFANDGRNTARISASFINEQLTNVGVETGALEKV